MKQTVYLNDFINAFQATRPDPFSREGLRILFDYFEQLEDATGESIDLDVVSISCNFTEDTFENIAEQYDIDLSDCEDFDIEDKKQIVREFLEHEEVLVGEVSDGFVYRNF